MNRRDKIVLAVFVVIVTLFLAATFLAGPLSPFPFRE